MKYYTFIFYTLIFISLAVPVGIVIFTFFDIEFEIYGSYLFWFIALALFNAILPYKVKNIYEEDVADIDSAADVNKTTITPDSTGGPELAIAIGSPTVFAASKNIAAGVKPTAAAAYKPAPAKSPLDFNLGQLKLSKPKDSSTKPSSSSTKPSSSSTKTPSSEPSAPPPKKRGLFNRWLHGEFTWSYTDLGRTMAKATGSIMR